MTQDLGRVLVTGANGSIGRRLIARLLGPSPPPAAVRALVRSERAAEVLRRLPASERPELVVAQYTDPDGISRAAAGCAQAVHLVGILKETSRSSYREAHETTATVIARAAEKAGVTRLVTLSVLGADADSPNPCLASKGRAERILLESPVAVTVIRVPMVLGADDSATRALRARARSTVVPLVRGGASRVQPIAADDVAAGIANALLRPELEGAVLELAGPESLPYRELLERAANVVGRRPRVLPLPLAMARAFAALAERAFADPPLTRAMLEVVERDECIDARAASQRLGLALTPLDEALRRSLEEAPRAA